MREIKFRAWDNKNNKMVSWGELIHNKELLWSFFGNEYHPTDPPQYFWKRMQYTGLKDKNGIEIYEGDIVNFNGKIIAIEYNTAEGLFWGGDNSQRYIFQYCDMLEVIGNIYENSELLGKEE